MKQLAIYDDRLRPDDESREFLGVDRFSVIRFRRRTLLERARTLFASAGITRMLVVQDDDEAARVVSQDLADDDGTRIVILPSSTVFRDADAARILLAKMAHLDQQFMVATCRPQAPTTLFLDVPSARRLLLRPPWQLTDEPETIPYLNTLPDQAGQTDLTDRDRLIDLLSGTFDVRHFNSVRNDGLVVTKRSSDAVKMRREHAHYAHLSQVAGPLRLFFLEPLELREGPGWAEYDTERIGVPDAAVQWIHGSFDQPRFRRFLDKLGEFLVRRPQRPALRGRERAESLYLGKVGERQAALAKLPSWNAVAPMLERALPGGGLEALTRRFSTQWSRFANQEREWHDAVSHGDLCLSNILYCRQSRMMKFIDPRGAASPDEVWMERHYDLAKLSHSLLGDYDFVNHDLCELSLGNDLRPEMTIFGPEREHLRGEFRGMLDRLGMRFDMVRACEASLFLSMLPLHADVPKKVLAFAMIAEGIVSRLEQT